MFLYQPTFNIAVLLFYRGTFELTMQIWSTLRPNQYAMAQTLKLFLRELPCGHCPSFLFPLTAVAERDSHLAESGGSSCLCSKRLQPSVQGSCLLLKAARELRSGVQQHSRSGCSQGSWPSAWWPSGPPASSEKGWIEGRAAATCCGLCCYFWWASHSFLTLVLSPWCPTVHV